ncbi:hypothetical protein SAMN05428944_1490 [Streptomyces sp. 1222.5]|nr:hypothetical protein BX260_6603 [Streptomyces sp. 5112.2]SEB82755.1 hypothetical protein SAMN05428944_1490 [Streptomyces sp. 1222.5]
MRAGPGCPTRADDSRHTPSGPRLGTYDGRTDVTESVGLGLTITPGAGGNHRHSGQGHCTAPEAAASAQGAAGRRRGAEVLRVGRCR